MKKQLLMALATGALLLPVGMETVKANSLNNNLEQSMELAQDSGGGRKRGHRGGMKRVLNQLDLTPEQTQQVETIQQQFRANNEPLREELQTQHQQMRSLFSNDATVDELREQHQAVKDLREQFADNRFEQMLQIREVLTPEQRDRLAELMANKFRSR